MENLTEDSHSGEKSESLETPLAKTKSITKDYVARNSLELSRKFRLKVKFISYIQYYIVLK